MEIYLDRLDAITQERYREFQERVQELLATYQESDRERFDSISQRIKQTERDWDTTITLISGDTREDIDITQLLAYEYCLAAERITQGKVAFEEMVDKLFEGVQKFRIGNPVPGVDDECLYGRAYDDITAIPVTAKKYRFVMGAEAQHLDYIRGGELTGAVFIYERGAITGFAQDEHGNPVDMPINGIDFSNLRHGQSLLTNLRQTVFHEWTHTAEKEIINPEEAPIAYEYQGADGITYRNYERISNYVTAENIGLIQEPQYIISTEIDENGRRKQYYRSPNGELRPIHEVKFGLEQRRLPSEICVSTGLSTEEVMPNGETQKHNQITEGFVERTARAMIIAIEPEVRDIAEGRYQEHVAIADRVISSRDSSMGENGEGQTYADFLMHSSILKRDLEQRNVELTEGTKVDGLHYIANYADRAHDGRTERRMILTPKKIRDIFHYLQLGEQQKQEIGEMELGGLQELSKELQERLRELLLSGKNSDESYVDSVIAEFARVLAEEKAFYDGIPEKLGYARTKSTQDLGRETLPELKDTHFLDELEAEQVRQERDEQNRNQDLQRT